MTIGPLKVSDLVVEFVHDGYAIRPLDGLSFGVEPGELVVLLGPSGCGKTTLLSCLGGILTPTSGSIQLGDLDVTRMNGKQLDAYRRDEIGFVFQAFNLIPSLTARENIAVPLTLTGHSRKDAFARADDLLEEVGLADRAITCRASCRAARCNAWRSPAASDTTLRCCSPTNRLRTSITSRPKRSSGCCRGCATTVG